jgi:para-aminobenzoate synthetase/4-amino-4-deoxychorismate lyase
MHRSFRIEAAQASRSVLLATANLTVSTTKPSCSIIPRQRFVAWHKGHLEGVPEEVDRQLAAGAYVAGYFNYECGESHGVGKCVWQRAHVPLLFAVQRCWEARRITISE